ncbi:MAG: hypothetical protein MJ252_19760, partial [archaeon]|nr:hypothetical protein [archaeon]
MSLNQSNKIQRNKTPLNNLISSGNENDIINYQINSGQSSEDYNSLKNENEHLMQTLRDEMLRNEEQRNYINILKEALDSNLMKNGIGNLIKNSKQYQTYNQEGGNISDFFIDFNKYKSQSETFRQELQFTQNELTNSNEEIKALQKEKEDLLSQIMLLKGNYETNKAQKEILQNKENNTNEQIKNLKDTLNTLQNENNFLKNEVADYKNKCQMMEKVSQNATQEVEGLKDNLENLKGIKENYELLNSMHENLKNDFLKLKREKNATEGEIVDLIQQNKNLNQKLIEANNENQKAMNNLTEMENRNADQQELNNHIQYLEESLEAEKQKNAQMKEKFEEVNDTQSQMDKQILNNKKENLDLKEKMKEMGEL